MADRRQVRQPPRPVVQVAPTAPTIPLFGPLHAADIINDTGGGSSGASVQAAIDQITVDKSDASHTHAAADVVSGVISIARLATGTPDGTKFIRDDGTLAVPSGGGGGGATFGTATLDFGAFPGANEASVAVTGQTAILGTSKADVFLMASDTTADHTANDHRYAALLLAFSAATPDVGVGFTIHARCLDRMQGTFAVRWRWS